MPLLLTWLLNAAYLMVLVALSPVIAWQAWRTGKYREGYGEKLLGLTPIRPVRSEPPGERFCVWLHAVSVGEVNLLATTLGELRTQRPEWEVVVSTTTKTGYDLARKKYGAEHSVFYCPLDFSWATRRAVRRVRPDLLVLAELELWPNLIAAVKQIGGAGRGGRVAIINGRLSDGSFRGYSRVGWLVRRVLGLIDLVAAQDEATAERFRRLGATNVVNTGSLKYDGAETDRQNVRTQSFCELAGISDGETVWLAGSTQAPEESICLAVYKRLVIDHPNLRLILVPRHPERFDEVATLLEESGLAWIRRTELNSASDNPQSAILVDAVGELGAWWGVADIGFVGGSFGDRGGQNMIEPTAYGVATCFGPNTKNFRDIVAALKAADGVREVADEQQLEAFVRDCLTDQESAAAMGDRARAFIATQLGATRRTVDRLTSLVDQEEPVIEQEQRVA